jgi:hypothetical protein
LGITISGAIGKVVTSGDRRMIRQVVVFASISFKKLTVN